MSETETTLLDVAARLRAEFDGSFARPPEARAGASIDLIAVHVAGEILAIRLGDIAGLHTDLKITPCPSPAAEFRGIAGMRAELMPVYDLAQLLGAARSSGRWMVVAAEAPVAFAFDAFETHFRVPADGIAESAGPTRQHVHAIVRHDDGAWPIIDISSLVAAIRKRAAAKPSFPKEH